MLPLQITFKGLPASSALEANIRIHAAKLAQVEPRIIRCAVVVEAPHRHHRRGRRFSVRVHLTAPGADVDISRDPGLDGTHEDPYIAVRDAFDAARRRLDEHAARQQAW